MSVPYHLRAWALRHHVSEEAMKELGALIAWEPPIIHAPGRATNEAGVQSQVRLEAAARGVRLWRNNVGVLKDSRGVPVRYGLANDSAQLNAKLKSADLIGWRPVMITVAMVGSVIGQFVSRECKRPGWTYAGGEHEEAQLNWATLAASEGCDATFTTGPGSL